MSNIYHEKQRGNYCRCHAINNLVGKQIVTTSEFDMLCDEYDTKHQYEKGVSRCRHYFINNGGTNNIFGHVFQKKGYSVTMTHYDYYKQKSIQDSDVTYGCIVYNMSHTFCIRRINGVLYKIDSMQRAPQRINMRLFQRRGYGIINVICS